jgi:4-diphosphocytidyl-2-C-methyl-D-erythritol kinase
MVNFPPCKINIGLYVTEKRPDGYHNLETCFYPIPFTDILEVIKANSFSFTSTGLSIPGNQADNLCVKAFELIQKDFGISPVAMHLHKVIPTGAGLGGGSSDAAHTLRLLNEVFELNLSINTLQKYAQQLGSDCSFFLQDQPMLGLERGDRLEEIRINLRGKFLVLLKPSVHVSTAGAYRGVTPSKSNMDLKNFLSTNSPSDWKEVIKNDFEPSVFIQHPIIGDYKNKLYQVGATYASMSGSGSSIFGIFDEAFDASATFPVDLMWSGVLS